MQNWLYWKFQKKEIMRIFVKIISEIILGYIKSCIDYKKIVVIIWHYYEMYTKRYNNFHQSQCAYYGFNIIDIYKYCYKNNILNVF